MRRRDAMGLMFLEVTYRRGKRLAAYLYLPRRRGDVSVRTEKAHAGLVIDFAADGRPIGIEITAPGRVTIESINRVLVDLKLDPATAPDFAPLAGWAR